jgi:hypothetical protein
MRPERACFTVAQEAVVVGPDSDMAGSPPVLEMGKR